MKINFYFVATYCTARLMLIYSQNYSMSVQDITILLVVSAKFRRNESNKQYKQAY